jgi:hypothetical protein
MLIIIGCVAPCSDRLPSAAMRHDVARLHRGDHRRVQLGGQRRVLVVGGIEQKLAHPFVADWDQGLDTVEHHRHLDLAVVGDVAGHFGKGVHLRQVLGLDGDKGQVRARRVHGPAGNRRARKQRRAQRDR